MESIPSHIHFTDSPDQSLLSLINEYTPDRVAILVDENTRKHCLPILNIDENNTLIIEIKSGEDQKTLGTCSEIWSILTNHQFSRKSMLVNLGGGVIGDMGGFVAATYKRGIRFINVPTTLLAQVDASIGGKLGVDFEGLKNHIGLFRDPDEIIISSSFLPSLGAKLLRSGYAEVIKHALIFDAGYWKELISQDWQLHNWNTITKKSVLIKNQVVLQDPYEQGLRKILNFGHTLGHAVETWKLTHKEDLLHGEAVALGMIMEAKLAHLIGKINDEELNHISSYISSVYPVVKLPPLDEIMEYVKQDKKNEGKEINFSLVDTIGTCSWDVKVNQKQISESYAYYQELYK